MIHIIDDCEAKREILVRTANGYNLPYRTYADSKSFLETVLSDEFEGSSRNPQSKTKKFRFDPTGDCVLLDVELDSIDGIQTFQYLKNKNLLSRLKVIFVTGFSDVTTAVGLMKDGAFDYMMNPTIGKPLVERINQALEASKKAAKVESASEKLSCLTKRELEVLRLMLLGKINKVIGSELNISRRTVEMHRANIFSKMGVKTPVELANLLQAH